MADREYERVFEHDDDSHLPLIERAARRAEYFASTSLALQSTRKRWDAVGVMNEIRAVARTIAKDIRELDKPNN